MDKCDEPVMDFPVAADVGKFSPKKGGGVRPGKLSLISSFFLFILFDHYQMLFFVRRGRQVGGVELRHLAG